MTFIIMGILSNIFSKKLKLKDKEEDEATLNPQKISSNVAENEEGEISPFLIDDENVETTNIQK